MFYNFSHFAGCGGGHGKAISTGRNEQMCWPIYTVGSALHLASLSPSGYAIASLPSTCNLTNLQQEVPLATLRKGDDRDPFPEQMSASAFPVQRSLLLARIPEGPLGRGTSPIEQRFQRCWGSSPGTWGVGYALEEGRQKEKES